MLAINHLLTCLLVTFLVSASPLESRTQATIKKDLNTVAADLVNITTATNAIDGKGINTVNYINKSNKLEKDTNQLETDVKATPTLTAAQCKVDLDFGTNTIEPQVREYVSAAIAKKKIAQKNGFASVIKKRLSDFQNDIAAALLPICSRCSGGTCPSLIVTIDQDLQKGIDAYNS